MVIFPQIVIVIFHLRKTAASTHAAVTMSAPAQIAIRSLTILSTSVHLCTAVWAVITSSLSHMFRAPLNQGITATHGTYNINILKFPLTMSILSISLSDIALILTGAQLHLIETANIIALQ